MLGIARSRGIPGRWSQDLVTAPVSMFRLVWRGAEQMNSHVEHKNPRTWAGYGGFWLYWLFFEHQDFLLVLAVPLLALIG